MRRTFAPRPRALSLALGAFLALSPAGAHASAFAPTGRDDSQTLLAEGDTHFAASAWDDAIASYRASYSALTPEDQASYFGALPVRKAMRAYEQRLTQEQDPSKRRALLEDQRAFLDDFTSAVNAKAGAAEEVGEDVIAELAEARSSIETALAELPEPDDRPPAEPQPKTIEPTPPPPDEITPPSRDWLGLGLVIGGSALLVPGIYVSTGWWSIRSDAEAKADASGEAFAPGTEARADYLASEEDRARKFLIAGTVVASIGLATAIGGAVHLILHRRRATRTTRTTALHALPLLAPGAGGLALHRRF